MNKQIEEMAREICVSRCGQVCCDACPEDNTCLYYEIAEALYNAGYRKQVEGKWKQAYNSYPRYVCTNCNHLYNNKEYKYCPYCGAKMKGDKTDEPK